jgi:acyl-[acyl-carrier-protein]-phospholipid O-acyltransferase/long-chain-fatty-acid--[acyl-carrier-protein] ligase
MKEMFRIKGTSAYIIALFLNAFTDLGHKIIIQNTVFKIYDDQLQIMLTAIVNALILLPFILLFTPAGFLSDRFPKNRVMTFAAALAVVLTLAITFSYYMGWFEVAFGFTFLLAAQSAIYSPAKYGYIKELVGNRFITAGNAAVQAATTVAILSGIVVYTLLFENSLGAFESADDIMRQVAPLGWLLVISSLIELYLVSRLPNRYERESERVFRFKKYINAFYLRKNLKTITRKRSIFEAILALSVFWGVSQVALTIFGAFAKTELGITNTIYVQGVLALTAIGIILGALFAARFSRFYIHTGLVPFSAIGMALSMLFIPMLHDLRPIALLFFTFGFSSGAFIVPLNAYIQKHAPGVHLGTILAGNNFIQNIFMVTFLMVTTFFAYEGLNATNLFYLLFALTLAMALHMTRKYLLMFTWFVCELVLSFRYNLLFVNSNNVPHSGPVLLLGNHISWIDWLIVQFPLERRMTYMMDRNIYNLPLLHRFFKWGRAIPLSAKASKDAFRVAKQRIADKELVTLFPEGTINRGEALQKFQRGFELVARDSNGVIVPFYIGGIWGSRFSRSPDKFVEKRALHRRKVTILYGDAMPMDSTAEEVQEAVQKLKDSYYAQ